MNKTMCEELGNLGINVHENISRQYNYTELIRRAEEGDKTALFNLHNVARHYDGEDAEFIRKMAYDAAMRIEKEENKESSDEKEEEETE